MFHHPPQFRPEIQAPPLLNAQHLVLRFPPDVKTFEDGVRWYTNNWFGQTIEELKKKVIVPLADIDVGGDAGLKDRLSSLSQDAVKKVSDYVHNVDPEFWRDYSGGKEPVARGLFEEVDKTMQPLYGEMTRLKDKINTATKEKKDGLSKLIHERDEIKSNESILESRLKSLESPIGKIPVGLTEFIKLFPLLIVILIVAMTIYLHRSKRLCDDWMEEYNSDKGDLDSKVSGYITSLWYLRSYKGKNLLLLLIISILTISFIRSIFLIAGDEELFISLARREDTATRFLFISIYLTGAIVIAGCVWFMLKVGRQGYQHN